MSKNNQKVKYKGFQSIYGGQQIRYYNRLPNALNQHEFNCTKKVVSWSSRIINFLFCKNCFYLQTRKSRWSQTACVHHLCNSIIVVILKKPYMAHTRLNWLKIVHSPKLNKVLFFWHFESCDTCSTFIHERFSLVLAKCEA